MASDVCVSSVVPGAQERGQGWKDIPEDCWMVIKILRVGQNLPGRVGVKQGQTAGEHQHLRNG